MIYRIIPTDWGRLLPKAKQAIISHGPQILTGVGLSALIGGTVVAVKNTPKAYEALREEKERQGVEKLPLIDVLRIGAKYYIVPAGLTIAGSICVIGGLHVSEERASAWAALAASEAVQFKDFRDVTEEKVGHKKFQDIDAEASRRELERDGVPPIQEIEESGHGTQIVWWPLIGRYFRCDISWIRRVENEINREIDAGDVNENDPYDTRTLTGVALNRFMLGVGIKKCDLGMMLGWNGKNKVHIRFYDIRTDEESETAPILVMKMDDCMPREKYDTVYQKGPQYIARF